MRLRSGEREGHSITVNSFLMVPKLRSHSIAFVHRNGLKKKKITNLFNPFPPSVLHLEKHSILILERIYESVDKKSLSLAMSRKTTKDRIQAVMS